MVVVVSSTIKSEMSGSKEIIMVENGSRVADLRFIIASVFRWIIMV